MSHVALSYYTGTLSLILVLLFPLLLALLAGLAMLVRHLTATGTIVLPRLPRVATGKTRFLVTRTSKGILCYRDSLPSDDSPLDWMARGERLLAVLPTIGAARTCARIAQIGCNLIHVANHVVTGANTVCRDTAWAPLAVLVALAPALHAVAAHLTLAGHIPHDPSLLLSVAGPLCYRRRGVPALPTLPTTGRGNVASTESYSGTCSGCGDEFDSLEPDANNANNANCPHCAENLHRFCTGCLQEPHCHGCGCSNRFSPLTRCVYDDGLSPASDMIDAVKRGDVLLLCDHCVRHGDTAEVTSLSPPSIEGIVPCLLCGVPVRNADLSDHIEDEHGIDTLDVI